jgi:hypothetical protein
VRLSRRLLRFGGVPLGVVIAIVIGVSHATWGAFEATTANAGSSDATGTVALSDDDGGATYSFPNLAYGQVRTWCTTVTFNGSLTSDVRLYASAAGGTIPAQIALSVDAGSGGDSSCAGFTLAANLYTGTLGDLAASDDSWATGLGGFTGAGNGDTRTYRFSASLIDSAAPVGSTATATLTWEARNQ